MKAMVSDRYGGPEVMELRELPKPSPRAGEVLIKVHATCVNTADWRTMRADPFIARLTMGLFKPSLTVLGSDVAGTIEAIGPGVTRFKPGDEVFADLYFGAAEGLGGFAEYAVAREDKTALKPQAWSFEEAAAMPMAGQTALAALRLFGPLAPGAKVLVHGASGGVGHAAVQIAKALGAEVTGITSTRNVDFVRSLGADHVIDYLSEDFTKSGQAFDLVVDCVGNKSVGELRRVLGAGGKAAVVGFSGLGGLLGVALRGGQDLKLVQVKGTADDLATLAALAEAGQLRPTLEKTYRFADLPAAVAHVETGRVAGKVVVAVA